MADEKPSYLNSTTSLVLFVACAAYVLSCLMSVGVGLWKQQVDLVDFGRTGLEGLVTTFLGLYGVRKGIEVGQKNHAPPTEGGK